MFINPQVQCYSIRLKNKTKYYIDMKIAHIIHPVIVSKESDLLQAQPIVFRSMQEAKEYARGKADIELYATKYADEDNIIPKECDFRFTKDLDRHVAQIKEFQQPRKLAILSDILQRLYESSQADYLIYSNVDIVLRPHFYNSVQFLIEQGHDAFSISRRTVPKSPDINMLFMLGGDNHPGCDCFVFKRELYPLMQFNDLCIGTKWVDDGMLVNLICHAKNFIELKDVLLTFHLGNDQVWEQKQFLEYIEHNRRELADIMKMLESNYSLLLNRSSDPLRKIFTYINFPTSYWEKKSAMFRIVIRGIIRLLVGCGMGIIFRLPFGEVVRASSSLRK